ncbi:MAG: YeeE/YedE family protein [Pseudomonadales bacterium]
MHDFVLALIGGSLIGSAAVLLMASNGSIMGVSGIASRLLPPKSASSNWGVSFFAGVFTAPILAFFVYGAMPSILITDNGFLLVAGGLLVGLGTVVGNGCTSGHGVCGLSRFSRRSAYATTVFMLAAIATVYVMRRLTGA